MYSLYWMLIEYANILYLDMAQLVILVDKYEATSCSIVDASTKKAFESPAVRKALVGYAKAIQRIANLSILPEREMRVRIILRYYMTSRVCF
jgi:hypothetical protein